jgi:predicted O-linked N-acetylglucosamine transferase (SPINDLY family)
MRSKPNTPHSARPKQTDGGLDLAQVLVKAGALQQAGQAAQAVALYRQWLAQPREAAEAALVWFNLGVLLRPLGDLSACMDAYQKAMALNPRLYQAAVNLGLAHEAAGQREQALQSWRQALQPAEAQTLLLNHSGRLLDASKQYPEAENALLRSLLADPDQPAVTQHYMGVRRRQCLWPSLPLLPVPRQPDPLDVGPFYALAEFEDPALQLEAARRFVQRRLPNPLPAPLAAGRRYGHKKLRIGYLSGDFRMHAVSFLTAEVFELHNRDRVEVYGLDYSLDDGSALRQRVLGAFDVHLPLHQLSDAQAAEHIARHEIDVLVDLTGLTAGSRFGILPLRPAPVQVSYLGYMGSSALPGVDYVLADRFVFPPALQAHFTEKPLYLPHTYQVNDRSRHIGPAPSRASQGLPDGAVVLCSFNNTYKITPQVFAVWMRILLRAPEAVLWLLEDNPNARSNLLAQARAAGVSPDRLHFAGRVSPSQYLARYRCADLFLDTSPYNAGTTASDALWAGLPVLTCPGRSMVSRMAGSLVRAAGLPELAVQSWQAYEDMAVDLACRPGKREALRSRLAALRDTCALFDSPAFVRDLEDVLCNAVQAPGKEPPRATAGELAS